MAQKDDLQRGDIVFFRGAGVFPRIASYSQSYPYRAERPWHHVAVCVGRDGNEPRVVGFQPDSNKKTFFGSTLVEHGLTNEEFDIMRPPRADWREAIADESERIVGVGVRYSMVGLFSFSMATQSRMTPVQQREERTGVYHSALGVDIAGRRMDSLSMETCVTAITRVLDETLSDAELCLRFTEPPPVLVDALADEKDLAGYIAAIGQKLDILRSQASVMAEHEMPRMVERFRVLDALANYEGLHENRRFSQADYREMLGQQIPDLPPSFAESAFLADYERRRRARIEDYFAPGPGGGSWPPDESVQGANGQPPMLRDQPRMNGRQVIDDYVIALGETAKELLDLDIDFESEGRKRCIGCSLPSNSMIISPAMLFHALWPAGFTPVGELKLSSEPVTW